MSKKVSAVVRLSLGNLEVRLSNVLRVCILTGARCPGHAVVPAGFSERRFMIRFQCPHCGTKLTIPDVHAGRDSRCPRCKNSLTVPPAPAPELKLVWDEPTAPARGPAEPAARPPFAAPRRRMTEDEAARERRREQELLASLGPLPVPERTGERKLPWLIDVLLYPASVSGIITLLAVVLVSLILPLAPLTMLIGARMVFLPHVIIGLYCGWYLAECVHDSARGGTRAPELFDADVRLSELWSRVSYLLAVYIVFILPAVLYRLFTHRTDAIFVALVIWAVAFFPMGLLAMVVHDSTSVLNPLFLLGAMVRVFFPYIGLLLLMAALAALVALATWALGYGLPPVVLGLMGLLASTYASFIMAHVLGRFYWRYRDRLDWGL
jgi:hypothetical protein